MKVAIIAILVAVFAGCSKPKETTNDTLTIQEKFQLYLDLMPAGGIYLDDCDALLFNGLAGSVPGVEIDLQRWRAETGLYLRRCVQEYEDCYHARKPDGSRMSESQCSRDMYLGLMIWLYHADWVPVLERLEIAREIFARGEANGWVMCEGDRTRTKFSNSMIGTLAWLIYHLGGEDHPERENPLYTLAITGLETGFERHLAINHAYLRAELTGRMAPATLAALAIFVERDPHNPLAQVVYHRYDDGDQENGISLLMDETHWPNDRLPDSSNHCGKWAIQRDSDSDDWKPCPDPLEIHSGGDWLYVASIILR